MQEKKLLSLFGTTTTVQNLRTCTNFSDKYAKTSQTAVLVIFLTLVLLNPDRPCFCKQCRSRSVGFFRSQLIWICSVCHSVYEFMSTFWIKLPDWLKIRSGRGILIYLAWQGLMFIIFLRQMALAFAYSFLMILPSPNLLPWEIGIIPEGWLVPGTLLP